jgi:hypothetical protein
MDNKQAFELLGKQIGDIVKEAVKIEFVRQGHKLTGGLINSIDYRVNAMTTGANIEFLLYDYGMIQNFGVKAERIPFNPGSGAKSSKYIDGLKLYARLRFGVDEKQAQSIAFAIAYKHKKEGMPTKASARFSSTGKRTGAIEAALDETESEVVRLIDAAMLEYINTVFLQAWSEINGKTI